MNLTNLSKKQKISFSIIIIVLYLTFLCFTKSFSFDVYQIRIATSLYSLSYLFPFLVFPLGLANLLGNLLFGSLGVLDVIGGLFVGIFTCYSHVLMRKFRISHWSMLLTLTFIPALMVPLWLSKLTFMPYPILFHSICMGQIISAFTGVLLVQTLKSMLERASKEAI